MNTCCVSLNGNKKLFDAVKDDDYEKVKDFIQNDENVIKNRFGDLCNHTFEEEKWLPSLPWNVAVLNGSHKVLELIYNKLDSLHEKEIIHLKEDKHELNTIQLLIMVADKNLRSEEDCVKTFDFLVGLCENDVADYLIDVDRDGVNCLQMACQYQTLKLMMKIFQFEGVYKFTLNRNANLTKEFYDISGFKDINSPCKVLSPLDCIHSIKKQKLKEANELVQNDPLKTWIKCIFEDNENTLNVWLFYRVVRVIFIILSVIFLFPGYSEDVKPLRKWSLSSFLVVMMLYGLIKGCWLFSTFIKYWFFVYSKSLKQDQYMGLYYICDCFMYAGLLIFLIGALIKRNESLDLCKFGLLLICLTAPWHVLNGFRISTTFASYTYITAIQKMILIASRFIPILLIIFIPFVICFKLLGEIHNNKTCITGIVCLYNNGTHSSHEEITLSYEDIVISNDVINITSDLIIITAKMSPACGPFDSWSKSAYTSWLLMLGIADIQSFDMPTFSVVLHVFFSVVMSLMVLNFVIALFVNAHMDLDKSRHVIGASQNLDVIRTLKDFPPKVFIQNHIFGWKKSKFITLEPEHQKLFKKTYIPVDRKRTYITCNLLRKTHF